MIEGVNPFPLEDVQPRNEFMADLQAELTSLDRRRFYILSLMAEAERNQARQLTLDDEQTSNLPTDL